MAKTNHWIAVSAKSLPQVKDPKHAAHIFQESELLFLKDKSGKTHVGVCRVYKQDVNAPHINVKKGDFCFLDQTDRKIDAVAYYPLIGISKLLDEPPVTK